MGILVIRGVLPVPGSLRVCWKIMTRNSAAKASRGFSSTLYSVQVKSFVR
jgi:hypothetical protein